MTFTKIVNILNNYIRIEPIEKDEIVTEKDKTNKPMFVKYIARLYIRRPETEEEKQAEADGAFNPMDALGEDMLNKIYSIKYSSSFGESTAIKLIDLAEGNLLKNKINSLSDINKESLINELSREGFVCKNVEDLGDLCFRIIHGCIIAIKNKKIEITASDIECYSGICSDDFLLINEVDSKCPLCGEKLIVKKNGKNYLRYQVVDILPNYLRRKDKKKFEECGLPLSGKGDKRNKIALCREEGQDYIDDPDVEIYKKLLNIKNRINVRETICDIIETSILDEKIAFVVRSLLSNFSDKDMNMVIDEPITIDEKITDDRLLNIDIHNHVDLSYMYIKNLFGVIGRESREKNTKFETIRSEINNCYHRLKETGVSQNKIYDALVQLVKERLSLNNDGFDIPCRLVVSFFIQNCAAFKD